MPRGGARPNSGPKRRDLAILDGRSSADREAAAKLISALNRPMPEQGESYEVAGWRVLWEAKDLRVRLNTRQYLYDKRDGKAVQMVKHVGPIELVGKVEHEHIAMNQYSDEELKILCEIAETAMSRSSARRLLDAGVAPVMP